MRYPTSDQHKTEFNTVSPANKIQAVNIPPLILNC